MAYWDMTGPPESLAVAVAWILMAISGRWSREPGWIDGFGLVLGVFWLVTPPIHWLVNSLISPF